MKKNFKNFIFSIDMYTLNFKGDDPFESIPETDL